MFMTGKLPSFFKETIEAMLNLCLTVYLHFIINILTLEAIYNLGNKTVLYLICNRITVLFNRV